MSDIVLGVILSIALIFLFAGEPDLYDALGSWRDMFIAEKMKNGEDEAWMNDFIDGCKSNDK